MSNVQLRRIIKSDGSIITDPPYPAPDEEYLVKVGQLKTDLQHGNRGGGTLHAIVNNTTAGFASPEQAARWDAAATAAAGIEFDKIITLADGVGGPFEGFPGGYREVTGTVFPTAITWYTDFHKTTKIIEKLLTYTGPFVTSITWNVYDSFHTLVSRAVDTINYSGPFETTRTRVITTF